MEASRFFSLTAGAIFLAVCAYAGAAVYSRVERPEIETVSRRQVRESVELQGIVLRQEQSLSFGWGTEPLAQSGQRLASGQLMGLDGLGGRFSAPAPPFIFQIPTAMSILGRKTFCPEIQPASRPCWTAGPGNGETAALSPAEAGITGPLFPAGRPCRKPGSAA